MPTKADLRRVVLARRARLPAAERAAAGEALAAGLDTVLRGADRVAAYYAVGSEPPTSALLALCREVLLPVLLPGGELDWAAAGELRDGPHGLFEPTAPRRGAAAIAGCDVVLVPALAVDGAGNRLGRGGGCYDRALRRATGLVVALLYDGELVDRLPAEPHDVPVDAVMTPAGGLRRLHS